MKSSGVNSSAVVIGGGFYGASIAIYLAKQRGFKSVTLIEQDTHLLARASYNNQARVHNGYHYPRSFTTAYRSRINLPKFVHEWPDAITKDFTKIYAIARRNSKVTSKQFIRFCKEIGADIQPAKAPLKSLFVSGLIEDVFLVEEYAFDATKLETWASGELRQNNVRVLLNTRAEGVSKRMGRGLNVKIRNISGSEDTIDVDKVFNCAYSGLNHLGVDFGGIRAKLKHEITELALMQLPEPLNGLGITVMDGAFFSLMPFPSRKLHTMSHVRYTPHMSWQDDATVNPYEKLKSYRCESRADRMTRDIGRYLPLIREAKYVESLFEVKTVLSKNESDDGRPILFEVHEGLPGCYSVLGGKIDNIYDVLARLDREV